MKKLSAFAFVILFFFSSNSLAQTTINAGMQFPSGNTKDALNNGYGGSLSFGFSLPILPLSLAISAGYNTWKYNDNTLLSGNKFYVVPVMLGVRFFSPGVGLKTYVGGDVGVAYYDSNAPGSNSSTKFAFSPVLGLRFNLSPVGTLALDLNARYWVISQSGSTINWFGINGGVSFGL